MNKTTSFHPALFLVFWAKFQPVRLFRTVRLFICCQNSTLYAYLGSTLIRETRVVIKQASFGDVISDDMWKSFWASRQSYLNINRWCYLSWYADPCLTSFIKRSTTRPAKQEQVRGEYSLYSFSTRLRFPVKNRADLSCSNIFPSRWKIIQNNLDVHDWYRKWKSCVFLRLVSITKSLK